MRWYSASSSADSVRRANSGSLSIRKSATVARPNMSGWRHRLELARRAGTGRTAASAARSAPCPGRSARGTGSPRAARAAGRRPGGREARRGWSCPSRSAPRWRGSGASQVHRGAWARRSAQDVGAGAVDPLAAHRIEEAAREPRPGIDAADRARAAAAARTRADACADAAGSAAEREPAAAVGSRSRSSVRGAFGYRGRGRGAGALDALQPPSSGAAAGSVSSAPPR